MDNLFVLCPDGWGVNLKYCTGVSNVTENDKVTQFYLIMSNGHNEYFNYKWEDYDESLDELFTKVDNIRMKILMMANNNIVPKKIDCSIDLKKRKHDTIHNQEVVPTEGDN